ncbi:MAG: NusG domain II-containing protein [Elusimicrobia bacterium]|nr:NusG domain II-containing protein [Elusimicrobiota bacterium]
MNKEYLFKPAKFDYMLAVLILILGIAGSVPLKANKTDAKKALIYKDNVLVKEIDMPISSTKYFVIEGTNIEVEVKNNKIRISKVSCPLKVCQHVGWISFPYQTITCLPNRLFIKIIGKSEDNSCDAVAY